MSCREAIVSARKKYPTATLFGAYNAVMVTALFIYQVCTHGHA